MSMMMGISSPNTRRLEFRDKGGKVVGSVTIKSAKSKEEAAAVQLQGNFHKAFKRKKVGQRASGTD